MYRIEALESFFQFFVTLFVVFLPFHLRFVRGALSFAGSHRQQFGVAWGKDEVLNEIQPGKVEAAADHLVAVFFAECAKVVGRDQDALEGPDALLDGLQQTTVNPLLHGSVSGVHRQGERPWREPVFAYTGVGPQIFQLLADRSF
jgi:hypothetical protein